MPAEDPNRQDFHALALSLLDKIVTDYLSDTSDDIPSRSFAQQVTIVGQQYNVSGQTGAVGPGATAHDNTFHQAWMECGVADDQLESLTKQLGKLRGVLRQATRGPEDDIAIAAVAAAEIQAGRGDGPAALSRLRDTGGWCLSMAEEADVPLAIHVMKAALSL